MKRGLLLSLSLSLLLLGVFFVPSYAQDWGGLATISSTVGVNDGRICTGEQTRGDIGCAANAPFVSRATGYVGIGTTSPSTSLEVSSLVDGLAGLTVRNTSSGINAFAIAQLYNDGGQSPTVLYLNSSNRTPDGGPNTATLRNDSGDLRLQAGPNGYNSNIGMRIQANTGYVGLLNASPSATLHIGNGLGGGGDATYRGRLILENYAALQGFNTNNGLEFKASGSGSGFGWRISNPDLGAANTPLAFESRVNSTTWTPRMLLGPNGYIGINTITPTAQLEVSGTISATQILVNGSPIGGGGGSSDRITSGTTQAIAYQNTSLSLVTAGVERVVVGTSGKVGIGQQPGAAALSVSGSIRIAGGGEACDANGVGTLKVANNRLYLCVNR